MKIQCMGFLITNGEHLNSNGYSKKSLIDATGNPSKSIMTLSLSLSLSLSITGEITLLGILLLSRKTTTGATNYEENLY